MSKYDELFLEGLKNILDNGIMVENERTGENCLTIPRLTFIYDESFVPITTVKQGYAYSAWAEILGYLRQYQWATEFKRAGANTWFANANNPVWQNNPNCEGENHVGKVYGAVLEKAYIKDFIF